MLVAVHALSTHALVLGLAMLVLVQVQVVQRSRRCRRQILAIRPSSHSRRSGGGPTLRWRSSRLKSGNFIRSSDDA
jgi:hypothetical protein